MAMVFLGELVVITPSGTVSEPSPPTGVNYLTDEDGNYILDENGNKIIIPL